MATGDSKPPKIRESVEMDIQKVPFSKIRHSCEQIFEDIWKGFNEQTRFLAVGQKDKNDEPAFESGLTVLRSTFNIRKRDLLQRIDETLDDLKDITSPEIRIKREKLLRDELTGGIEIQKNVIKSFIEYWHDR